jgi:hypothetical protein
MVTADSTPAENSQAVPSSSTPDSTYVPVIMTRRPRLSKKRASSSGPSRFPTAMQAK